MSLAVVHTRALIGIRSVPVQVEVHLSGGLPSLSIVGLPEAAVRESKDRVRAAIQNSQFEFPARRITVNLAPADLPKEGGRYDLPIALGILIASGQLKTEKLEQLECVGELALGGALRPVHGILPTAMGTAESGRTLVFPADNFAEASLAEPCALCPCEHLLSLCEHLARPEGLPIEQGSHNEPTSFSFVTDFCEVKGQYQAKRALEVAAAGSHNLLMIGPPGTGKSMLATRLPTIMPPLTNAEAISTAAVRSISSEAFDVGQWQARPFRSPHHTASGVALVGGGSNPRPGEISLANNGILFLDELPEFDRRVLDVLREPMETGTITISRAARQAEFPARFQLVAAMNPCPCGYYGDSETACRCSPDQRQRYLGKVSGPLLDRIDLHVEVGRVEHAQLQKPDANAETSTAVRTRVIAARKTQLARAGKLNVQLTPSEIERFCSLQPAESRLLESAVKRIGLSARGYHRILKTARTIADLGGSDPILSSHLGEAIAYRSLDRVLQ